VSVCPIRFRSRSNRGVAGGSAPVAGGAVTMRFGL
jgi:hypothetical protein